MPLREAELRELYARLRCVTFRYMLTAASTAFGFKRFHGTRRAAVERVRRTRVTISVHNARGAECRVREQRGTIYPCPEKENVLDVRVLMPHRGLPARRSQVDAAMCMQYVILPEQRCQRANELWRLGYIGELWDLRRSDELRSLLTAMGGWLQTATTQLFPGSP